MNNLSQPSSVLKAKFTDIIRDSSARAEKDGRLTKAQLGLIFEQNWFKMLAPSASGGMQLSMPDAMRMVEAISWADGSVGWQIALCAVAGWQTAFADAELAKGMLADAKACIAGGGEVTGTAEKTDTGYIVTGKWPFATGSHDATAFTADCTITVDGQEETITFLLTKEEVSVTNTWNPMGLIATSANTFEVKGLAVTEDRAFKTTPGSAKADAPLYKFPYLQLAEAIFAASISGMAYHFADLSKAMLAEAKNKAGVPLADDRTVAENITKLTQSLEDARTKLYYAADLSWQGCVNFQKIKPAILYKVSAGAYELARQAAESVSVLYPYCGLQAVDKNSEINRVWRDLHTACQNRLLVLGSLPE